MKNLIATMTLFKHRTNRLAFYCLCLSCLSALPVIAQQISEVQIKGGLAALFEQQGQVLAQDKQSRYYQLDLSEHGLTATPSSSRITSAALPSTDSLPDTEVSFGTRNIRQAWLIDPTQRYGHGVLGDAIEAGGLRVITNQGLRLDYRLTPASVFEDRKVRLADLDGDGNDELLVVRSYLDLGAALAVFRLSAGQIQFVAETPPIGIAHRWLNPVGVADFDGDGRPEIAIVVTPHIGGLLKIYQLQGTVLRQEYQANGFSNHALGSRILAMSAIVDVNGDRVADLAIPSANRRALRVVTFADGKFRELSTIKHKRAIVSAIFKPNSSRPRLIYGLGDGTAIGLRY